MSPSGHRAFALAYESVDFTFKYKNKKATRVNLITDDNQIPLTSYTCALPIADSQLTKITLEQLPIPIKNRKRKPVDLIADGGYQNQKREKLKGRYKIEHVNAWELARNCERNSYEQRSQFLASFL